VLAELPGFTASDIEVSVEPATRDPLAVNANRKKRQARRRAIRRTTSDENFPDPSTFPREVNVLKVTAMLKDGS